MLNIAIATVSSFLITLVITPVLIRFLKQLGIVGIDQHKRNRPVIASSGGLCVAIGILGGLLIFIGLETFLIGFSSNVVTLLAIILSILIATLVGVFDDLNVSKKHVVKEGIKEIRIGIPQWVKPLLTLPAAVPLMVVNAGNSYISLPLIGLVDAGILYPLLLVPIGVVGASNAINMLGGFNGMEAGMGLVYMLGLGIFALLTGKDIAILFIITVAALLAFIRFNWYPAKILPGDSLTYLLGAVLAAGVIVANMEKLGILLMAPFLAEFFLKYRSKFSATSLGRLSKDGTIESIYGRKIYSLTHIVMNFKRLAEWQISTIFILAEAVITVSVILFYTL